MNFLIKFILLILISSCQNFEKFNSLYNKKNFFYFGKTKYQYILKYKKKIQLNPGTYVLQMKFKKIL